MAASDSRRELVVRVLNAAGHTAGVGVLVGQQHVLTCAHVVNAALGRQPRTPTQPEDALTVEISGTQSGRPVTAQARVQRWLPPPQQNIAGDDIAGLLLEGLAPAAGAVPARLTVNPPPPGALVDVFGYPGDPPRPDGAWVEAKVRGPIGGGRMQLDSTADAALRIQPGYSGSPVYDRASGRVVGLLATAPGAGSQTRDSYAITAEQLRLAWPEVLDHRRGRPGRGRSTGAEQLTILHISDPQFGHLPDPRSGARRIFGGNGLTPADQAHDTLFSRLHDDLDNLAREHGLRPDLMVVTGDLADKGMPDEFEQVLQFLTELTEAVDLPRQHVVIVPGNHDVNRKACQAYFLHQEADQRAPVPPYWAKWEHFVSVVQRFYHGVEGVSFTPDEPWTLFEMPDLAVVVAGLNSTMAESHTDHYGWVGELQLRWFADRLARFREQGWLRLAAVHHNVVRGAVLDDENLRDADDLDRFLGQPGLVNLLLHGHTHDGRLHRLSSGLVVLSTGSAAVSAEARPREVPNQYQLLDVRRDGVTRHARQYVPGQRRWIGDTRVTPTGSDWRHHQPCALGDVGTTFPLEVSDVAEAPDVPREMAHGPGHRDPAEPGDEFLDRVLEATRVSHPGATVTSRPEGGYLRVSRPLPSGGAEQWPVGVVDGEVTEIHLESFVTQVHLRFASADPGVPSVLVYSGAPAAQTLVAQAQQRGVRLRSFVDYQGLVDLRPLLLRQTERLDTDRIYPAQLYVPQSYRLIDDDPAGPARPELLDQVVTWLGADGERFVMLLGDFGRGKTFLLRQLARTLAKRLPGLMPVLVELRSLEKAPSLDELLAQHLVRNGVESFDLAKLRYMIRSGRLALLFDGFDELELRVGYDNAADYLQTLLHAVTDRAKVVLTSRTQHFRSTAQIRTALGDQVNAISSSRMAVLADFDENQILRFLTNHYQRDVGAAQARFDLLEEVQDLLGLSRNPRMLSFIADLDEQRLREVQAEQGRISAAELYRELVDFWLVREVGRQQHRAGVRSLGEQDRLAACTALALRLWGTTALTIPEAELATEVATTLTQLAKLGYTTDQATHAVGSSTLLVRTDEGTFAFVHQSVMEWLVADATARQLQQSEPADTLTARRMSALMLDFLCDLAGHDLARSWAATVLSDAAATGVAKQNALAITRRLGGAARQNLARLDLRDQDFTGRDLQNADLSGANLRGMRLTNTILTGADLRDADLTGVRMIGGDLTGTRLAGSRWHRASLLGVSGLDEALTAPELAVAAIAGRDPAEAMIAPTGSPADLAFSPDGALLAQTRGHCVEIIDLASSQTLRVLTGHTNLVTAVAFSPDGTRLATTSDDGTARIWDPTTGQHHTTLTGHTGRVTAVAFSPDGTRLATTSRDGTARIWDPTTGQHHSTLTGHTRAVTAVAFSPDGTRLATASDDRTARIWDPTTGQHHTTLTCHTGRVTAVAFSPDGTRLATTSDDHTARIWDPTTGQHHSTLTGHTRAVTAVTFSPDGTRLATASWDQTARIWDLTDQPRNTGRWSRHIPEGIKRVVGAATGQHHTTLTGHTGRVTAVAFSPDGTRLATASWDETARIWDPATGQHHTTLTGHSDWVRAVAFSPDGTRLATASDDYTARIWDPATGQHHTTLTGHTGWVTAVAFSPDGTRLATASNDRTIRLWDAATGVWLASLFPLQGSGAAVLLPDGSYKLDGDPGNILWWAIKLCRFTPGELDPYLPEIRKLPPDAPILGRPLH